MYVLNRKSSKAFCRNFKPSSQNVGIPSCSCSMFNCCSEGLHRSLYPVVMFASKICLKLKGTVPVITARFVLNTILRSNVLFQKSNVIFKHRFVYRPFFLPFFCLSIKEIKLIKKIPKLSMSKMFSFFKIFFNMIFLKTIYLN